MAFVRPARFAHKRTVRFKRPDYDSNFDTKTVLRGLSLVPDKELVAIVPLYSGKCYDITFRMMEYATALATRGLEVDGATFPKTLLGTKSLHVSVFVLVEYPDELLLKTLRRYGELKTDGIRRAYFKEEGLRHLENGAHVVEFARLHQNIPRQIVVGGIPIGFKYSGQPNTCFKCGSADHLVRNCPKKPAPCPQEPEPDTRGEPRKRETAMKTQAHKTSLPKIQLSLRNSANRMTPALWTRRLRPPVHHPHSQLHNKCRSYSPLAHQLRTQLTHAQPNANSPRTV